MKRLFLMFVAAVVVGAVHADGRRVPTVAFSAGAQHLHGQNKASAGSFYAEQPARDRQTDLRVDLDFPLTQRTALFGALSSVERTRVLSEQPGFLYGHKTEETGTEYRLGIRIELK